MLEAGHRPSHSGGAVMENPERDRRQTDDFLRDGGPHIKADPGGSSEATTERKVKPLSSALQTYDFFAGRAVSQSRSTPSICAPRLSSTGCLLFVAGDRLLTTGPAAENRVKFAAPGNDQMIDCTQETLRK